MICMCVVKQGGGEGGCRNLFEKNALKGSIQQFPSIHALKYSELLSSFTNTMMQM